LTPFRIASSIGSTGSSGHSQQHFTDRATTAPEASWKTGWLQPVKAVLSWPSQAALLFQPMALYWRSPSF